ncbi:MAG: hypothetical protein IPP57_23270 [Candidatus Obscuribacter sp.]|nr:hypothetical protein [Candidatus Obscuribacter sp.]MBK9773699.1 hypothetical protein [Candidatus Obscuribacter sp.]
MSTNENEKFEKIIKSTPSDELEAMCKMLTAGTLVKNLDRAGSIISVDVLNTLYSDPVHIAAIKRLYQVLLVTVSEPIVHDASGDKIVYAVNSKGREFLDYYQKQTHA